MHCPFRSHQCSARVSYRRSQVTKGPLYPQQRVHRGQHCTASTGTQEVLETKRIRLALPSLRATLCLCFAVFCCLQQTPDHAMPQWLCLHDCFKRDHQASCTVFTWKTEGNYQFSRSLAKASRMNCKVRWYKKASFFFGLQMFRWFTSTGIRSPMPKSEENKKVNKI